jgi:hypothetical protein
MDEIRRLRELHEDVVELADSWDRDIATGERVLAQCAEGSAAHTFFKAINETLARCAEEVRELTGRGQA